MTIFIQLYKSIRQLRSRITHSEIARILGAIAVLALTGAFVYSRLEGWSFLDALYATIITITTVGYGDVAPRTPEGRIFAIFFTLIAISIGGYAISTLAVYIIERRNRKLAHKFRKRLMKQIGTFNQHYILCGADLLGTRIAEEFYLEKVPYVVIDDNEALLKTTLLYSHPGYFEQKLKTLVDFHEIDLSAYEDLTLTELSEKLNIPYLLADPTDDSALLQAGIERAAGLVAARPDDRDNLSIVIGARSLAKRLKNDSLRIMTRANDPRNMRKLYLAGADFVRIPTVLSGMEMASHILYPEIGRWWYSRTGEGDNQSSLFAQVNLSQRPHWVGQTISQIHEREQIMIVGVKRDGEFISPPPFDLALQADDITITLKGQP